MKKLLSITTISLMLLLGFVLVFSSCKDDDDKLDAELTLDKSSVEVYAGENATVTIKTGNGGYMVSSSSESVATAAVSDQSVTISGVAKGSATVTVKDQADKTATVSVTIETAIIDATTARFKWENTIALETTNNWGTTILSDRVAVTNLSDKKQYVLSWTGGYTVGEKTGGKLRMLESGTETQEITLTNLEVQKAENNLYSLVFSDGTKNGELVFTK